MKTLITTKREFLLAGVLIGVLLSVAAWAIGTALGHL